MAYVEMFGRDACNQLQGCTLASFLPDAPALLAQALSPAQETQTGGNLRQDGTAVRHGERFPVSMAAAALDDGSVMLLVSDMTERALMTKRLQELARTDPLTGLANRRTFIEVADMEFHRFRRTGLPSSMLMIDIDHFKNVNDLYGHQAGDDALVRLAAVLSNSIRITDTAVRFGGEEFILLMTGTEINSGRDMAERVRDEVAKIAVPSPHGTFGFTVSIGVASFCPDDSSWQDTLRRADEGLYLAKAEGRNKVVAVPRLGPPAVVIPQE
jgi:diguanylate cyclase (GGDEF)-like protein